MRRLLKFLHTLGSVGFMGGMTALLVVLSRLPFVHDPAGQAALVDALAKIAALLVGPSMVVTVISGLLAIAVTPGFQDVAWVWIKAATGILILEGGLHVLGPFQEEAKRHAGGHAAGSGAAQLFAAEVGTLWLLLAVSAANIALGVWRPKFRWGRGAA